MKKFELKTGSGKTEIYCGIGCFEKLPKILKQKKNCQIFVIIDKNVSKYHSTKINKIFRAVSSKVNYYYLKPGENSKSLNELNKIYNFLKQNNCSKDSILFAIGGGVTGDIAGFAASTYMRGINLIHIPTTLLSMVDSSIGGKTAVNFADVKNLIGNIHQPKYVFIDPAFLDTLPEREVRSGIGEILKYSLLVNNNFFQMLKDKLPVFIHGRLNGIDEVILLCARYKSSVVQIDENDIATRKILNLGHTFGHAIESELEFKLSHGECVVFGLKCMLCLSKFTGMLNEKKFTDYMNILSLIKTDKRIFQLDGNKLINRMAYDKKNKLSSTMFVLIRRIGEIVIDYKTDKKEIARSIETAKQF